jgi:arylsulfatase A-like enzyme
MAEPDAIARAASGAQGAWRLSATTALAAFWIACSPPEGSRQTLVELADELPVAAVAQEAGRLDLGTASARRQLESGFSWDERADDGLTFCWSSGPTSTVTFFLARARPLTLALRGFPYPDPKRPPQSVEVAVNGHRLDELTFMAQGPSVLRQELPASALVAGENRLELRYGWLREPPSQRSSGDRRRLAVGWDWIALTPLPPVPQPPSVSSEDQTLTLPAGSQVDFFVSLPAAGARFDVALALEPGAQLELFLAEDGVGDERQLAAWTRGGAREVALVPVGESRSPAGPGQVLARLRLRVVAKDDVATPPVARLTAARVTVPSGADPPPRPPPVRPAADALARAPTIIVYLVDTLRADRLGAYGYSRATSPAIDAFAREGVVFEAAIAQTSWTKPAVTTLMTGLGPRRHRVNDPRDALPQSVALLSELLQRAGYTTGAVVANAHLTANSGLARGFDHYAYSPVSAAKINHEVFAWIDSLPADRRPLFLYVHTIDPHAPYEPDAEYRRRLAPNLVDPSVGSVASLRALGDHRIEATPQVIADLNALYDSDVAMNDAAFGELIDGLRKRDLYDDSLVVFVSDHGEAFREHGVFGHGWDLFEETLHVPLIVRRPGAEGSGVRVAATVRQLDLAPTLLRAAGLVAPPEMAGIDLLADPVADQPAHAYLHYEGREGASLTLGRWHVVEPLSRGFAPGTQLFDRSRDPAQVHDVSGARPVLTGYLQSLVRRELLDTSTKAAAPRVEIDEETRRQLEALGYAAGNP